MTKPRARTHLNGYVSYLVLKLGNISEIFEGKPYLDHHGVQAWKAKLPYDNRKVSVELMETANTCTLKVWPPERKLNADQLDTAQSVMISEANDVVAHLTKQGGWQFGPGTLHGSVEHGLSESLLAKEIPQSVRTAKAAGMWYDHSEGVIGEPETTDVDKAKIVLQFPERLLHLEGGQDSLLKEVQVIHLTMRELLEVQKLAVQLELERLKGKAAQETERLRQDIPQGEAAQASQSSVQDTKYEVMYR